MTIPGNAALAFRQTGSSGSPSNSNSVVDAFLAAVPVGDFEALVAVLDPEIVLRAAAVPRGPHFQP